MKVLASFTVACGKPGESFARNLAGRLTDLGIGRQSVLSAGPSFPSLPEERWLKE